MTFSFVAFWQKTKYKAKFAKYVTHMSKFQTSFIINTLNKMDLIRITTLSWDMNPFCRMTVPLVIFGHNSQKSLDY